MSAPIVTAFTLTLKRLCWPLPEMSRQPLAPKQQYLLLSCLIRIKKYLDLMGTTGSSRTDRPKNANFPL